MPDHPVDFIAYGQDHRNAAWIQQVQAQVEALHRAEVPVVLCLEQAPQQIGPHVQEMRRAVAAGDYFQQCVAENRMPDLDEFKAAMQGHYEDNVIGILACQSDFQKAVGQAQTPEAFAEAWEQHTGAVKHAAMKAELALLDYAQANNIPVHGIDHPDQNALYQNDVAYGKSASEYPRIQAMVNQSVQQIDALAQAQGGVVIAFNIGANHLRALEAGVVQKVAEQGLDAGPMPVRVQAHLVVDPPGLNGHVNEANLPGFDDASCQKIEANVDLIERINRNQGVLAKQLERATGYSVKLEKGRSELNNITASDLEDSLDDLYKEGMTQEQLLEEVTQRGMTDAAQLLRDQPNLIDSGADLSSIPISKEDQERSLELMKNEVHQKIFDNAVKVGDLKQKMEIQNSNLNIINTSPDLPDVQRAFVASARQHIQAQPPQVIRPGQYEEQQGRMTMGLLNRHWQGPKVQEKASHDLPPDPPGPPGPHGPPKPPPPPGAPGPTGKAEPDGPDVLSPASLSVSPAPPQESLRKSLESLSPSKTSPTQRRRGSVADELFQRKEPETKTDHHQGAKVSQGADPSRRTGIKT